MRRHQQNTSKSSSMSPQHTHTTNIKTLNLSITPNIMNNETFTKLSKKNHPECSKNCGNNIFRKKKYNNLLDEQKAKVTVSSLLQPTSPTTVSQTPCCCSALEETLGKTQNTNTNRRSTPNKKTTPTKTMGKEKKSITTENIVGLAMATKCSLENLDNSISLKSDNDVNAQATTQPLEKQKQTATTRREEKTHSKSNNLIKKAMVVEKLKSTNSVITRKLFSNKKAGAGATDATGAGGAQNSSAEQYKDMQKSNDSTDLDMDKQKITLTTTEIRETTTTSTAANNATTLQNDDEIVQEDNESMISSLLRTTTL
ncbi:uncharacterized protein LOC105664472 [Ceratitis capitata]|uniref:Uncharacterized protein n=1 Tax=Ceratitis capitata TaxID=7213 RepID=W8BQ21_CERCA|nr:uncharacterized protein LOC105664472 [Ceratitis capitata]